jgi:hypothetical protein
MGCFCHSALLQLPSLNVSASLTLNGGVPLGLSAYLSMSGLPALPWTPEPGWLGLPLPSMQLSAQAAATISAMASLRAQVLAQFGIDLLNPAQVAAFARIIATMNARLSMVANLHLRPWIGLGQINSAIDQIQLALQAGLLAPVPSMMLSLTVPGGIPMARWGSFLAALLALCPMISAMLNLNLAMNATAELAAAMGMMARLSLPALAFPQLMAQLTAALNAVASLQASLGVSPLALGFPAIQLQVQAKLNALLPALCAHLGISMSGNMPNLLALLLSLLPKLPVVPTGFATSATVQAAMQASAVASLNWNVPISIPAVQIGMPTIALAAALQAALGIQAVLPSPCGSGCDAAKIARALAA